MMSARTAPSPWRRPRRSWSGCGCTEVAPPWLALTVASTSPRCELVVATAVPERRIDRDAAAAPAKQGDRAGVPVPARPVRRSARRPWCGRTAWSQPLVGIDFDSGRVSLKRSRTDPGLAAVLWHPASSDVQHHRALYLLRLRQRTLDADAAGGDGAVGIGPAGREIRLTSAAEAEADCCPPAGAFWVWRAVPSGRCRRPRSPCRRREFLVRARRALASLLPACSPVRRFPARSAVNQVRRQRRRSHGSSAPEIGDFRTRALMPNISWPGARRRGLRISRGSAK